MNKSKIFFYFCLAFISGIFLSSIIVISQLFLLGFLILAITLISVLQRHKKAVFFGFCLIFGVLGIFCCQRAFWKIKNNKLARYNDLNKDIVFTGRVIKEPDLRENSVKLTIKIEKIEAQLSLDSGRVLLTTGKYPKYKYGDRLKITGKLETPKEFTDFNYKNYLAKEGIFSVIYWPEIELIEQNKGNFVYSRILWFKSKLREVLYQNISPPQSSILSALLLGDKSRMPEDLKEELNIAGIRHITAVSGMHIVILTVVLMSLLLGLGFWRGQAFYFSVVFIFLFILTIGAPASAIRAGIMGGLLLLGEKLGRQVLGLRIATVAAAFMLAFNPLLLTLDVGFQLSFLAVIGIIYFGPVLKYRLKFIPENKFFNLRSILVMTFSAQIFTLPVLVYNFGRVSLVSPITNILVLPFIYWIMLFGFIFVLTGLFCQPLGWFFSLPCWLLLSYVVKIGNWFSKIPFSSLTIENIHWIWLVIFYFILGLLAWHLNKKQKLIFLDY